MKRLIGLLMLAVAWCSTTSIAPVQPSTRTMLYMPKIGAPAPGSVASQSASPFIAWPLRVPIYAHEAALVVLRRDVVINSVPVGRAEAWSCTSLEEAQAVLQDGVDRIVLQSWCWYQLGVVLPLNTVCPARPRAVIDAQERRP